MNENDRKILDSLADTMAMTRDEIDGMRLVVQATVATLNARPDLQPMFAAALKAVIEADTAMALNSPMSDAQLERRSAWIARLVVPTAASSA